VRDIHCPRTMWICPAHLRDNLFALGLTVEAGTLQVANLQATTDNLQLAFLYFSVLRNSPLVAFTATRNLASSGLLP